MKQGKQTEAHVSVRIKSSQFAALKELAWLSRGTMSVNGLVQEGVQNWIEDVMPVLTQRLQEHYKEVITRRRKPVK